ncbi:MAG: D-alanyl-D-alanine endopeptidase [Gammaproteobacteria bacterium]|nr:D-alanyl-D-alanine endopeptidase [Gammaproteobacteria bacterium]
MSSKTSSIIVVLLSLALPLTAAETVAPTVQLASVNALVADLDSGEVLLRKHADVAVPVASVTKLMTALVVLDGGQPLDEWLTVVGWDHRNEKNAYSRLRVGSDIQRGELLRIALMSSENLATHVLARHYPGGVPAFVAAMNAKALELGMTQSQFTDPAGLSPSNQSSAEDLAALAKAAYTYDEVRAFSTGQRRDVRFKNPRYDLAYGNTNPLVANTAWNLGLSKTGYLTEAGRCLVMVAQIDERRVVMVLLNSFGKRSPLGDAGRVRRWLTTGQSGTVAGDAREYERRMSEAYRLKAEGRS